MRDDQPTITIVPATPGWRVSALYCGTDWLTEQPVIAWEITRYDARPIAGKPEQRPIRRYVFPICTDDLFNTNTARIDSWLLRDPDGRYHDGCNPDQPKFDDPEQVLARFLTIRKSRLSGGKNASALTTFSARVQRGHNPSALKETA